MRSKLRRISELTKSKQPVHQKYAIDVSLALGVANAASAELITGTVTAISDGDTLTVLDSTNRQYKIRLAEIDAPEKAQAFGQKSKQSLSDLCFRKAAVADVVDVDKYRRFVARVKCDGIYANREQVRRGFAWRHVRYAKEPSIAEAESEAKGQGRGLWSDPAAVAPWVWRKR